MTPKLEQRMKETLQRREKKVEELYKEKAINVLKNAEEYFVKHPMGKTSKTEIKLSNVEEAKVFFSYLRKFATNDNWKIYVEKGEITSRREINNRYKC